MAKDLNISVLLDFYGDVLTVKQRDVMEQYYNDDLSLSEIADNFSISRQGVRDSIKRGETVLLDLEEKVGFASKYRSVQDGLSQIATINKNILFYNNNCHSPNDDIRKQCDKVADILSQISE